MLESEKFKNMQNRKCYAYIIAGVVFQTIIILVFALTVMRIKTPSVRLRAVTVQNLHYNASATSPYFNMTLIAEIAVKNKNFGHFRFDNSTASVTYGGTTVGDGELLKGRTSARKTKRVNVTMDVSSNGFSDSTELSNELNSGILRLSSQANLRGKVTLMKVMKKRKTTKMNCTMSVDLDSSIVQILNCK
ncbi:hypothetical protein L1049_005710 [Liquidambar formosana]|uniref:Late embryogenesis abundant protein LEA-2 subgroup domain-containing protein n=1 Tax=Liquidambar formosana TaxID=63359 RepID=A0AAP0REQ0_LIQFO